MAGDVEGEETLQGTVITGGTHPDPIRAATDEAKFNLLGISDDT